MSNNGLTSRYEQNRVLVFNDPKAPRICPELAKEIGLNESIVFLQIEFLIAIKGQWLECNKRNVTACDCETGPGPGHFHKWLYISSRKAAEGEFIWWGKSTIDRIFEALIAAGLLIEGDYSKLKADKTRWLAINFSGARKLESIKIVNPSQLGTPNPANGSNPLETKADNGASPTPSQPGTPCPNMGQLNSVNPSQLGTPIQETPDRDTLFDITLIEDEGETPDGGGIAANDARNAEPYEQRRDRILRAAFISACGYAGRERLATGQVIGQINTAMAALIEDNPDDSIEILEVKIIGFGFYWVSGVWWNTGRGEQPKRFDPPSPSTVQTKWLKYETFCLEFLDGAAPASIEQALAAIKVKR